MNLGWVLRKEEYRTHWSQYLTKQVLVLLVVSLLVQCRLASGRWLRSSLLGSGLQEYRARAGLRGHRCGNHCYLKVGFQGRRCHRICIVPCALRMMLESVCDFKEPYDESETKDFRSSNGSFSIILLNPRVADSLETIGRDF
jgi:hypothetical protein